MEERKKYRRKRQEENKAAFVEAKAHCAVTCQSSEYRDNGKMEK